MNERLNKYFDSLFESAPDTKEIHELREEIFSNTLEKYNDFLAQGRSEEASFTQAVSGIGDLDSILEMSCFDNSNVRNYYTNRELKENRLKCNIMIAVSIMLFIFSIVPPIVLGGISASLGASLIFVFIAVAVFLAIFGNKLRIDPIKLSRQIDLLKDTRSAEFTKESFERERFFHAFLLSMGVSLYVLSIVPCILLPSIASGLASLSVGIMFTLIAVATGILVFYNCVKIDIIPVEPTTVVEDFKQWRKVNEHSETLLKTIDAIILSVAIVCYFFISFCTGSWCITWLIFVIAFLVYLLVKTVFEYSQMKK